MNAKTKYILIAAIVIAVLAIGGFLYSSRQAVAPGTGGEAPDGGIATTTSGTPPVSTSSAPTSSQPVAPSGITMAQVASHSSRSDCWTVIRGNVYNLTSWISKHPGGAQAILQLCGKDGTQAFVGQHGGSQQQESILATFKIGVLAN